MIDTSFDIIRNVCWVGWGNLQWCSRDRNLRDRDRDLVQISRGDRDFIKNSETETWSSRPRPRFETSKFVHLSKFFF